MTSAAQLERHARLEAVTGLWNGCDDFTCQWHKDAAQLLGLEELWQTAVAAVTDLRDAITVDR